MAQNTLGKPRELIIHPGEILQDILADRNMTQTELANRTGLTKSYISKIISGAKNISTSFAKKLSYALDIDSSIWINLQSQYDHEIAEYEEQNSITEDEKNIAKSIHRAASKLVSFPDTIVDQVLFLRRYISISNLCDIPKLQYNAAFRAQTKVSSNPYVLAFWLAYCERMVHVADPNMPILSIDLLNRSLFSIRTLISTSNINDALRQLQTQLALCGIHFYVVKNVTGAPVQGYIKPLSTGRLLLCLTLRGNRADTFWFTLFHEVGHILNGDAKKVFIDFEHTDITSESKADTFASNFLIPPQEYRIFTRNGIFTRQSILRFSKKINIPAFIIHGRLCKDKYLEYSDYPDLQQQYKWSN